MYHYTMSGLKNVWLLNGFTIEKSPEGDLVSINDIEGLHRKLAELLVKHKPHLTGPEYRFLRVELGLSQSGLARILGNDAQAVARWEKSGRVQKWADRFLRALWLEHDDGNEKIIDLIEKLNDMDQQPTEKFHFEETRGEWRQAA